MNGEAPFKLLTNGPKDGPVLVLAHGAGAPMDSPFMDAIAEMLGARGIKVVRFEFAYMAARRTGAGKRPPPRMPAVLDEYRALLNQLNADQVFIGGKSMGGRAASMLAAASDAPGCIKGVVCLGYPFHPPGKPDKLRTAHLADLRSPALIVQGERDPFGTRDEVPEMGLPESIEIVWCKTGNHDLAPLKRSGLSAADTWGRTADAVARFVLQHAC